MTKKLRLHGVSGTIRTLRIALYMAKASGAIPEIYEVQVIFALLLVADTALSLAQRIRKMT